MNSVEFEQLVTNNKHLNLLINEQQFSVLSPLKKTAEMTPEFIDWVSPKYYDSFMAIYDKCIAENEGTVCSVLRVSFLANAETQSKIVDFLMPKIDESIKEIDQFYQVVNNNRHDAIIAMGHLKVPFSYLTDAIYKHLNTPELNAKKEVFSDLLLKTADIMKRFSPRRNALEFSIYEKITARLKSLGLKGEQSDQVVQHEKTLKNKGTWYVVGTVIILILVLLRFLGRMG